MMVPIYLFIMYLFILKSILQPSHEKQKFISQTLWQTPFWVVQAFGWSSLLGGPVYPKGRWKEMTELAEGRIQDSALSLL